MLFHYRKSFLANSLTTNYLLIGYRSLCMQHSSVQYIQVSIDDWKALHTVAHSLRTNFIYYCSFTDGKSVLGSLFLGDSNLTFVGSFDLIGLLSNVELNVTVWGKIWWDSTMGSVGSSSSTDSSLCAYMSDDTFFWVKWLSLSVWLQVVEEAKDVLSWLCWESTVVMMNQ